MSKVRRALISVSDKHGVVDFARGLTQLGIQILSTGGTARLLREHDITVSDVTEITGFPEIMDGRVKTLHPLIHGGLLGRKGTDDSVMAEHGIEAIDLLVVNLYPFEHTVARTDCSLEDAIENIDIGGPAMLRAAAKNHDRVSVVVDPGDYPAVLDEVRNSGEVSQQRRFGLACKTFEHTASYDGAIASWLGTIQPDGKRASFPRTLNRQWQLQQIMRYGENPHQQAAFYSDRQCPEASVSTAEQLQGKALSFNNVADTDAALECVRTFDQPACVIVKHANPCGVAIGNTLSEAYARAFATDPTSAFGGIIAFNRPLGADTAKAIVERQFVEVVIAPIIEPQALEVFSAKPNVRVLASGEWADERQSELEIRNVNGGVLVQERDLAIVADKDLRVVSQRAPEDNELRDLLFTWRVARFVKSNAIVYGRDGATVGIGAGQMSRVYSARIAGIKAADEGLEVAGAVMASDAFFPFRDGIDAAAEAGIRAVIQPGGSKRDDEVIAAADEHGLAMVFTGMRHFRH